MTDSDTTVKLLNIVADVRRILVRIHREICLEKPLAPACLEASAAVMRIDRCLHELSQDEIKARAGDMPFPS